MAHTCSHVSNKYPVVRENMLYSTSNSSVDRVWYWRSIFRTYLSTDEVNGGIFSIHGENVSRYMNLGRSWVLIMIYPPTRYAAVSEVE